MTLLKSAGNPVIDAGENVMGLSKDVHPLACVFDPSDPQHILETDLYCQDEEKWTPAVVSNIKATIDHDLLEGAKDLSFEPSSVLDHRVTKVLVRKMEPNAKPTIKLMKSKQVRVKVLWKTGEISWVNANALRLQNPYLLVAYADDNGLSQHPDFTWTQSYKDNDHQNSTHIMVTKHNQGPVFKFGIQVPKNAAHAKKLDELSNNNLCEEAKKKYPKSFK